MKPHVQTNDVGKDMKERKGKIFLQSARYKTRLRETSTQVRWRFAHPIC